MDTTKDQDSIRFYNASLAYYWSEAVIYQGKNTIKTANIVASAFSKLFKERAYSDYDIER